MGVSLSISLSAPVVECLTMINVTFTTNIDKYKREEWPTTLPVVPSVGHYVKARSGVTLRIVQVTWAQNEEPYLIVELHTADGTVPR